MIHYLALTTGSCGNCYVFNDGQDTIVIDAGVTYSKLSRSLCDHGIDPGSIRAIFLTHLHPDHSRGVGVSQRKLGIPAYISSVSLAENAVVIERQRIERTLLRTFEYGETIAVGAFRLMPFRTSHDSPGSAGYAILCNGFRFFLMTDTGVIPEEAERLASIADVEFIEANYDDDMLEKGSYPYPLKRRIRGSYGHLSNREAVAFASRTARRGDSVYFVHLSRNNNDPGLVRDEVVRSIPSGIFCKVCERGEAFEGFLYDEESWWKEEGKEYPEAEGLPQGTSR